MISKLLAHSRLLALTAASAALSTCLLAQDKSAKKPAKAELPPFKIDYGKRPAPKDCKVAKWGPDKY